MRKFAFCTLLGIVSIFTLVATEEGQLLSLVAWGGQTTTGPETSSLFDKNRVHTLDVAPHFSVLAAGDIASCKTNGPVARTIRNLRYSIGLDRPDAIPNDGMIETTRILERHPDTRVLALGDLTYNRGERAGFADCYDPYWGRAKTRTWPAPGNHEYKSPFAYGYYDYWQDRAGPDREGYYALSAGNWLILSLNSEIDAFPGSSQAKWIKKVIAAYADRCIAAFYHKPAYSSLARDGSQNARELFRLLADKGASFVLNGHNHFYERTRPLTATGTPSETGVVNFVAGAGGKTTSDKITPAAFADKLVTGTVGVMKLDFWNDSVAWTYLTGEGSDEIDRGTLPCR